MSLLTRDNNYFNNRGALSLVGRPPSSVASPRTAFKFFRDSIYTEVGRTQVMLLQYAHDKTRQYLQYGVRT